RCSPANDRTINNDRAAVRNPLTETRTAAPTTTNRSKCRVAGPKRRRAWPRTVDVHCDQSVRIPPTVRGHGHSPSGPATHGFGAANELLNPQRLSDVILLRKQSADRVSASHLVDRNRMWT